MTDLVIGALDPGAKGGAAILGKQLTEVHRLDGFNMKLLRACNHVFIERVQGVAIQDRKISMSGMFTFYSGYGRLLGWLEALGVPFTPVHSKTWQKQMHAGTDSKLDTKKRSIQACQRIFPGVSLIPEGCRVPHDGIADALLLAEFGRRVLAGKE